MAERALLDKRRLWKLEKAARKERFDRRMGPGMSPAARRIDRMRVAEAADASYARCALCDKLAPHRADECAMTRGLMRGAVRDAGRRLIADGDPTRWTSTRRGIQRSTRWSTARAVWLFSTKKLSYANAKI